MEKFKNLKERKLTGTIGNQSTKILMFLDKLVVSNRLDNRDSKKAYKILLDIFGDKIGNAEFEEIIKIISKEGLLR